MRLNLELFALLFALTAGIAYASGYGVGSGSNSGNSYGTSNVSLNTSAMSIPAGASARGTFTVALASGTSYNTNFYVLGQQQLAYSSGITVVVAPQWGTPSFSGTFNISVSKSTAPGLYKVLFGAGGGDPSGSPVLLNVTVLPAGSSTSTTTTVGTTAPPSSGVTTLVQTTITPKASTSGSASSGQGQSGQTQSGWGAIVWIVVVLVIVLVLYKVLPKPPAAQQKPPASR